MPKLPGLDGRKMSKSLNNTILLTEDADIIEKKIKTMITDTKRQRKTDAGDPNVCPVFDYHKVFSTDEERAKIIEGCTKAEIGCIECKKILINNVENFICPIREKKKVLDKEIQNIDEFLAPSQKKANDFAAILMEKVRKAIKI